MEKYSHKQKKQTTSNLKYIFFINGIDSKVVAPCVCTFDHSSTTHKNSGKSEKSIIVIRTPPKWMVTSRGSGVWASLAAGLRIFTIEMEYENTPFCWCESHGFQAIWRFGFVVLGTGPWKHRVVLKIKALTCTHPVENFNDRYSDGYFSSYVSQNEVYRVQWPILVEKRRALFGIFLKASGGADGTVGEPLNLQFWPRFDTKNSLISTNAPFFSKSKLKYNWRRTVVNGSSYNSCF